MAEKKATKKGSQKTGTGKVETGNDKGEKKQEPSQAETSEKETHLKEETDHGKTAEEVADEAAPGAGEKTEGEEEEKDTGDKSVKSSPEYQALNEKCMRLYAEFDNYRKRTAKEGLELIQTANCDLMTKLIPTLEHFEIAFAPGQKAKKLEDFESGIKMIFNSFKDVLEEAGLEEINPEGEEFDPAFHEAMLEQHHDKVEEGNVIQVYQKGYKVKSKILKHAKVIISKGRQEKAKDKKA